MSAKSAIRREYFTTFIAWKSYTCRNKNKWKQIISHILSTTYAQSRLKTNFKSDNETIICIDSETKKQLTYSMKKKSIGTSKPSEILLNIQCFAVYLNQLNNVNQIWIFILKSHYRETTKWYFNQSYLDEQQ